MRPSPRPSLLRGTAGVLLGDGLLAPTGLLTAAFLTRHLGPEAFGLFTLAATVVAWLEASVASILNRTTVKYVGDASDWHPVGNAALRLSLWIGVGAALLVTLLAAPLAKALGEPSLGFYFRLFSLQIVFASAASAHRSILAATGGFRAIGIAAAGRWIARMLLIVALVEIGLSIPGAIAGSVLAAAIQLSIARRWVRPSLAERSFSARVLVSHAASLVTFTIGFRVFDRMDLFALKLLGGSARDAGLYGAAQTLALAPRLAAFTAGPLLLATLIRLERDGEATEARRLGRDALRATISLLPFAAIIAASAPDVAGFVYGSSFVATGQPLAILMLAAVAFGVISVATAILIAADEIGAIRRVSLPLILAAAAGHCLLIPRFGTNAAAAVTAGGAIFGAWVWTLSACRVAGLTFPFGTLARSSLLSGLASGLTALLPAQGPLLVAKLLGIGALVPVGFVLLGELDRSEGARIRSALFRARGAHPAANGSL
jgi:O-antigen/teichoic acid export membrane protein